MRLTVNGDISQYAFPDKGTTISDLFHHLNLKETGRFVEINGRIFKEDTFSKTTIKDGDIIEIIQFMGGGVV